MKKNILLLSIAFLLSSCSIFTSSLSESSFSEKEEEINHSYNEIKTKKLTWNDLFFDSKEAYSIYCYSLSCSHCNSIKNKVIEYALKDDNFYFYEDSSSTIFNDDIKSTIGISSSLNLAIKGFPTLLKINQKTLSKNIYGEASILNELNL